MRSTIRSLTAEAKLSVHACLDRLRDSGLLVATGGHRLHGGSLSRHRAVLGVPKRRVREGPAPTGASIDESEMIIRLLRPLRQKGKLGRLHTTPFEC
jgi:hypothetical protein